MAIDKNLIINSTENMGKPELPIVKREITPDDPNENMNGVGNMNDNGDCNTVEEADTEITSKDKTRGLPIDRGWAWVVLAACIFYLMLFGGIRKNFGIFFIEFQSRYGSNASTTALLNTMQNLILSVSSLLVMTVGMQFLSNRAFIITGSLVLTVANLLTAFATDINILFISVGVLEGLGTAMIHPTVTATLGEYFNKRRGFANGIAFSGASCGGLIFAPIMSTLFENYGYTGTLLIVAGMVLNICVTGVLLRPIKSFERKVNESSVICAQNGYSHEKSKPELQRFLSNDSSKSKQLHLENDKIIGHLILQTDSKDPDNPLPTKAVLQLKSLEIDRSCKRSESNGPSLGNGSLPGSPLLPRTRTWSTGSKRIRTTSTKSENIGPTQKPHHLSPMNSLVESLSRSRVALYSSTEGFCGSVVGIQEIQDEYKTDTGEQSVSKKNTVLTKLKGSFDLSLFKNPVFPIFLCMASMFAPSCMLLPSFLPPHGKDVGLTMKERGMLLSIIGGTGVVSRVSCALLADRKFVKLTTLLAIMSAIMGVTAHLLRFFTGFATLAAVAVIIGLTCEIYQAMYPVILVEYLTLQRLKHCIGFTILCHGFFVASTFPLVGLIRDMTGNYLASYHLLGTMQLVGGCLALLLPIVHRRANSKRNAEGTEVEV